MIKKFLLPLQNMVRADLFSGSLAVWQVRGEAAHFAPPRPHPAAGGLKSEILFELFLKYTAVWKKASFEGLFRPAKGGAQAAFERIFGVKRKRIYQLRAKEIF